MATPSFSTPSLFVNGDAYKSLRAIALQTKPDLPLDADDCYVGVLQHDHLATPEAFFWFKVKAKHSIKKLRKAYAKRAGIADIQFKFNGNVSSDGTLIRDLDYLSDRNVIFTAHTDIASHPSFGVAGGLNTGRSPLRHINSQASTPLQPQSTVKNPEVSVKNEENAFHAPSLASIAPSAAAASLSNAHFNGSHSPWVNQVHLKNEPNSVGGFAQYAQNTADNDSTPGTSKSRVEDMDDFSLPPIADEEDLLPPASAPKSNTQVDRIQKIIDTATPDGLEVEVRSTKIFLENLKKPLISMAAQNKDASHWLQQIETLHKQAVDTPTIIGVVGNTGAGKSSIINAMLDEERLVPTNCMRACTAVVTEMSWNSSNDENEKYRAQIEFIQPADWRKDLEISLEELLDGSGNVSRDCTNPESEAGIAYAKIKAVYPQKSKEDIAKSSIEQLMNEAGVKNVLGKTRSIAKAYPDSFYRELQRFVDSKEKSKGDKEAKQMEFWPLIKVVKIYVKADALSTGAVIVDLPGVHDSNAARAAVAAGYMKQCSGLFIVAPINRAVDDKAAKSLLGESFKRQLKFDGIYSRITFICSKTDDISISEAAESLSLDFDADWQKVDELEKEENVIKEKIKDLKDSKAVYSDLINDADDKIEEWEKLRDQLESGKSVYAPRTDSNKRKRASSTEKSRKKANRSNANSDDEDFINDEEKDPIEVSDVENDDDDNDSYSGNRQSLTEEDIDNKIAELKDNKKRARRERTDADAQIKSHNQELKATAAKKSEIDTAMNALCIAGRNHYSKTAIQRDFADGVKELDMEAAQEADPDQFDPDEQLRDYDEVAKTLPVFCVSSRAYQKLSGRLQRDKAVPGFRNAEETEVPQLQAHCKKLTEASRASNCRAYLSSICQLLTSLGLWAGNDGTGLNLSDAELAAETRYLKKRLTTLEKGLEEAVSNTLKDLTTALAENIFEKCPQLVQMAIQEANATVNKWHAPVNKFDRAAGGYYWATYKAIMRRDGVYSNAQGPHDFNAQLIEPIIKNLASNWEKAFAQKMPRVLQTFTRVSKALLKRFHDDIESRSIKVGTGAAGLALLGQQLKNYDASFETLSLQMIDLINNLQREANREFTPVIARNLASAYDWCAAEKGPGQYQRMKQHMSEHVEEARNKMFKESCDDVRTRLQKMCRQVEDAMSTRADETFVMMQRDYMEVVAGRQMPEGGVMPKWERKIRTDVAKILNDRDKTADQDAIQIVEDTRKEEEKAEADALAKQIKESAERAESQAAALTADRFSVEALESSPDVPNYINNLPEEVVAKLLEFGEPERCSRWLKCILEEDANESVMQVVIWKAYEACFMAHDVESGATRLTGVECMTNISTAFDGKVYPDTLESPQRFVMKGIKFRTVPIDLDGKPCIRLDTEKLETPNSNMPAESPSHENPELMDVNA